MTLSRHMSLLLALLMTAGTAASQPAEGEWLSYRDAYRALVVFDKYGKAKNLLQQHLQVMPRERGVTAEGMELTVTGKTTRLALPLDPTGRTQLPLLKAAYDENAVLVLNRGPGQYSFRPRVSIVVRPDGVYELADMRAACDQALNFQRHVDASASARQCVGVRFSFSRKGLDAGVRLRRNEGEGTALAVSDGAAFPDDPNDSFRVVNYRFVEGGERGQLVTRHAPLAIAPLIE
jgi:hypothetical protein